MRNGSSRRRTRSSRARRRRRRRRIWTTATTCSTTRRARSEGQGAKRGLAAPPCLREVWTGTPGQRADQGEARRRLGRRGPVFTAPPTGLNPHWIRYPGGMVLGRRRCSTFLRTRLPSTRRRSVASCAASATAAPRSAAYVLRPTIHELCLSYGADVSSRLRSMSCGARSRSRSSGASSEEARDSRETAGRQPRYSRETAEIQPRYNRDTAEV